MGARKKKPVADTAPTPQPDAPVEAKTIFVAPDAPQAVLVDGLWEGTYVFLLNDVPITRRIELPGGMLDTPEELEAMRIAMDDLQWLKRQKLPEDQIDDVMFLIDLVGDELHYAEAVMADDDLTLEEKAAEIVAITPRDKRGRFIKASH